MSAIALRMPVDSSWNTPTVSPLAEKLVVRIVEERLARSTWGALASISFTPVWRQSATSRPREVELHQTGALPPTHVVLRLACPSADRGRAAPSRSSGRSPMTPAVLGRGVAVEALESFSAMSSRRERRSAPSRALELGSPSSACFRVTGWPGSAGRVCRADRPGHRASGSIAADVKSSTAWAWSELKVMIWAT